MRRLGRAVLHAASVFGKQISIANALETTAGVISGASHALWLSAIPSGSDTVLFAGTQDLFRCSLAAGCAWRNATNVNGCAAAQVGPNQHGVAWMPGSDAAFLPMIVGYGEAAMR